MKLMRGEGYPVSSDGIVNKVYEYSGIVRDFFKNISGRNSIDNMDKDLILVDVIM
ncbi:MAG: M4 family metallopeptidase [Candidatus Kuenenia sp.]|nr:M4 family metallopeptidase [Candidatus Kuenenia hertensis]